MFAQSSVYRLTELWSVLPHRVEDNESTGRCLMRYGVAAWYVGVYCCCGIGIWVLRRQLILTPWLWDCCCACRLLPVHSVYWSNMRMRAPLMPFLALVATAGVAGLGGTKTRDESVNAA